MFKLLFARKKLTIPHVICHWKLIKSSSVIVSFPFPITALGATYFTLNSWSISTVDANGWHYNGKSFW